MDNGDQKVNMDDCLAPEGKNKENSFVNSNNTKSLSEIKAIEEDIDNLGLTRTATIEIELIKPSKKTFKTYCYLFVKRVFDIISSFLALIILSPLLLVITLLEVFFGHGSPIYKHKRLGYRGKTFSVLKFRSMRQDNRPLEQVLTPEQLDSYKKEFKIKDDPRVTKLGNFLRKTSLDELPQFFDVLIGKMSIVGPRPVVFRELKKYYKHSYCCLLSVKPGITGYWQAYGRNKITYESGERQAMELYYCHTRSLWLDLKIMFKTVISVIKKDGAE